MAEAVPGDVILFRMPPNGGVGSIWGCNHVAGGRAAVHPCLFRAWGCGKPADALLGAADRGAPFAVSGKECKGHGDDPVFAAGAAIRGMASGKRCLGLTGAVVGRAVGATRGRVIDQRLLGAGSSPWSGGRSTGSG